MLRSRTLFGPTMFLLAWATVAWPIAASAVVLWSDSAATLAHNTGMGSDLLGGAVKRDDAANDTLYFKFHVSPSSDLTTEEYFAGLQFFEGDVERLAIGNATKAWAYSAFFSTERSREADGIADYIDLHSANIKPSERGVPITYQYPERGIVVTIVLKVQYIAGEDDLVTVWLNPDLGPGANEVYQADALTTRFNANATFDELRLRHGGAGGGWTFGDIAIATSFNDFVDVSSAKPSEVASISTRAALALNFRSWQKGEGLPQSPVRALAQTPDGYIWVGSDEVVGRFDGVRFVSFGTREGLNGGPVHTLFADREGALWIGRSAGGLSRFHNGRATTFKKDHGLPSESITSLAEDTERRLWIGTELGLVTYQNGQISKLNGSEFFSDKPITALFKDRENTLWCAAKGFGLFQFKQGSFAHVTEDSVAELLKDVRHLVVDQNKNIWAVVGDDIVLCRDNLKWIRYRIPRHLAKPPIATLAIEPNGTVWAGSSAGGLIQIKEGKVSSVPASSSLPGNSVESLLVDQEGKLWVGTDSSLSRLRRKRLFALGQNEGLGFGAVHGLAEVASGVTWAVKPNDGLYRWDGKTFSRLTAAAVSPRESQINTLLVGRDGVCWVAGSNGVVRFKDPIAAADEAKPFELPRHSIISLTEDRLGALCAGTREGRIFWLREGNWVEQRNMVMTNPVTCMVAESEQTMWVGTDGAGIYRLQNGTLDHINRADGLLSDVIRTLYQDADGVLWIGTSGGGLSRWRDGRISNFTTHEGLPDNTISQILEDNAERLWLGTSAGIVCVSKRSLNDFTTGRTPTVFSLLYNRSEGMLSEECTGGFYPAGYKAASGLLWFSTAKGAVIVDPNNQPTNAPVPSVVLEEILVDGVPVPEFSAASSSGPPQKDRSSKPQGLRITPGRHQIELRYTGLSFDAPELLRFRYRLDGLDNDWVEANSRRTALYSFIPPGEYRFRVIACNANGVWTENSADLSLTVLRHFWQAWWFIGLVGFIVIISTAGVIRFIERRQLQAKLRLLEQERALEQERTRIAQDLHDEMGAKLCRISFLSEHARSGNLVPGEMEKQISSISEASREVLHSLDEIVWAVNPRNDTLEHLASYVGQYAQEYFQMTGIECEMDIPRQLPPYPLSSQVRHHLFLAVHEALTNILKHSGATRAKVSMTCRDSSFEVTVSDNGEGFKRSVASLTVDGSGDGMKNMHWRLSSIGGECRAESPPEGGTTIRFILPLDLKKVNA